VKKFIALLFVAAFLAAAVIGCTPATTKSGTGITNTGAGGSTK
jgi:hypothetical protein